MTQTSNATNLDLGEEGKISEMPTGTKRKPSLATRFYSDPTRVNPSIYLNAEAESSLVLGYVQMKDFEFLFQLSVQSVETRIIEAIGEAVRSASRAEPTKFKLPPLQCGETVWEFCKQNEFEVEFHRLWHWIAKHFPETRNIETSIYTDPEVPEYQAIRFIIAINISPEEIVRRERDFYKEAVRTISSNKVSLFSIGYSFFDGTS